MRRTASSLARGEHVVEARSPAAATTSAVVVVERDARRAAGGLRAARLQRVDELGDGASARRP